MLRAVSIVLALSGCGFERGVATDGGVTGDGSGSAVIDGTRPAGPGVRMIDLDDARITGAPHMSFPLLVSLNAPWLRSVGNGGSVARADGFDIYFSSDQAGTAKLAHEVELYAADTGVLIAWVRIPMLMPQTVLYLHYGDPALTTDPQQVAAVWSTGYEAVFHMDAIADAAGKNLALAAVTSGSAPGRIDIACGFDGVDDYVDIGSATAIDDVFAAGGTAEAWFYAETFGETGYGRIFDKGHEFGWSIFVNNAERAESLGFLHGSGTQSWGFWNTVANTMTLNAWHHVAVVYNQASAANVPLFYVDGAPVTVVTLDPPPASMMSDAARSLRAGNRVAGDRTFDGLLDELRLSSTVRSADWIATEVRNQVDPGGFAPVGPEL